MSTETMCTRCGSSVPPILSGPPDDRDTWWRNQIATTRHVTTYTLRLRMFKRRWLPKNPQDQLRETYTTLDLCDDCARAVFQFAQGKAANR